MKKKENRVYEVLLLIITLVFYLFFAFYDGVVICADSPTYINMSITREFLYSSLLAIFRVVFGDQYLLMIVVLQSILAAYAAWNISIWIRKQFSLGYALSTIVFFIPLAVSLLNRFAAGRASMYSNSILTEGITISLFLLFFRYAFDYLINQDGKMLWISIILSGILVATRKQMYVSLLLLFVVVICVKKPWVNRSGREKGISCIKEIGKALIMCIIIIMTVSLLDHTYNYLVRGKFVGHSSDSRFMLTMVFYAAEEEYVEELPEELRPLYLEIYEKCDSQGYLMHSAGKGWYNEVVHFGDYYDLIQIQTMWPAIQQFVEANYTDDMTDRELYTDDITNVMISSLFPKTAVRIFHVLFNNILSGLVTTIAQRNHILIWYSCLAYLSYISILAYYRKKVGYSDAIVKFCVLTMVSIGVNVLLVSAVIFCQTRYMIYNMPLFYISGLILLNGLYKLRKKSSLE